MSALEDEFSAAVCSITPERLAALQAAGVSDDAFDPPAVGMAPIETRRGGLFDMAETGEAAVIMPVGEWRDPNWDLEDLVAFHLDRPGRWWRRVGVSDVLGDVEGFSLEPKRVFSTPLDWLIAGGDGLVVIDWALDPVAALAGAGPLKANSPMVFQKLRRRSLECAAQQFESLFDAT